MLQSYRQLQVWQKSILLVTAVYKLTKDFPKSELYGLVSQIRRAATSIPANIAEGFMRKYSQEYLQFLRIAFGSGAELETHLVIAKELRLTSPSELIEVEKLLEEVMKMLNALIVKIESGRPRPPRTNH